MKRLTCAEAESLVGSGALSALPPAEVQRLEEHVAHCPEHRQLLAELLSTVSFLAFTADEAEPPTSLRQRVLDAVRASERPHASTSPARVAAPPGGISWRNRLPRPSQLATAAAILVAIGLGIGIGSQIVQPAERSWTIEGGQLAPGAQATLVYRVAKHSGVLAVTGLPALKPGQVYEAWLISGTSPVDAGAATGSGGRLVIPITMDVLNYSTLAITIEPGEQTRPTTNPILAGKLS